MSPINVIIPTQNVTGSVLNEMVQLPLYIFQHYEGPLVWMAIVIALITAIFSVLKLIGLL